jgi:hypothetical protein
MKFVAENRKIKRTRKAQFLKVTYFVLFFTNCLFLFLFDFIGSYELTASLVKGLESMTWVRSPGDALVV